MSMLTWLEARYSFALFLQAIVTLRANYINLQLHSLKLLELLFCQSQFPTLATSSRLVILSENVVFSTMNAKIMLNTKKIQNKIITLNKFGFYQW